MTRKYDWERHLQGFAFHTLGAAALFFVAAPPNLALAAVERGRTDDPKEGSEYGKGGYERAGGLGRFSLGANFGAGMFDPKGPKDFQSGLAFGIDGGYWLDDWVVGEASFAFVTKANRFDTLVGPRFRLVMEPIALNIGLKAGLSVDSDNTAFAVAPSVGAEFTIGDHVVLGLNYLAVLPVHEEMVRVNRLFLSVGYRF